jgi:AGZA family xanthine/uracil permease-like MFS transporter
MEAHAAAMHAWQIGICCIFISGIFKLICSFGSDWIRRSIPRAGLLGSLAAIALVIISFLPLLEILHYPMVGLIAMSIILTALVGRVPLPFKLPGAVGGLVAASLESCTSPACSDQVNP